MAATRFFHVCAALLCLASILIGPRSPVELDEDLDFLATPISPDLWAELRAEGLLPEDAPVP